MKFQFVLTLFICLAMQVLEAAAISVTDYYSITTSEGLPSNTIGAIKKDSLFWKLDSDVQEVLPVGAVGRYKISHSGKIYLQSHLPLLTQDLAYVCGDKRAAVYRFISKVQQCKLDGDKLMFYSSDDSLIFYRKK